jgi:hypothetical protein
MGGRSRPPTQSCGPDEYAAPSDDATIAATTWPSQRSRADDGTRIVVPLHGVEQGWGGLVLGSLIPCTLFYFLQLYIKCNRPGPAQPQIARVHAATAPLGHLTAGHSYSQSPSKEAEEVRLVALLFFTTFFNRELKLVSILQEVSNLREKKLCQLL